MNKGVDASLLDSFLTLSRRIGGRLKAGSRGIALRPALLMAYFFLPSGFQKRLLRYALSRLELLDTDALELENLDIAWGKRSIVELRDVGLQLKVRSLLVLYI